MTIKNRRGLVLGLLWLWLGLSITATLPFHIGLLDLAIYQLPAFLLLRFVPVRPMLLIGVPIAALVALVTPSAYVGFWIEIFSFIVVLISLDSIAANGRPEDRLQAGYFALLIFCFPFYATALYFYEGLALIHSMAHAAKFVIPTLVSLVLSEVLWHWAKRLFGDAATDIARPEERSIPSLGSLVALASTTISSLVLLAALVLWASSWSEQLERSLRREADRFAEQILMSNHQGIELRVERLMQQISVTEIENENPYLMFDDRFLHVLIDAEAALSDGENLKIPEAARGTAGAGLGDFIDGRQFDRLIYRAGMGQQFAGGNAPFYVELKGEQYPVHIRPVGESSVVFSIDTDQESWITMGHPGGDEVTARTLDIMTMDQVGIAKSGGSVFAANFAGGVLWNPIQQERPPLSRIDANNKQTKISLLVSETVTSQFPLELPYGRVMVIDLEFWPYFEFFCRVLVASAVLASIALLLSLWLTKIIAGRLTSPIDELLEALGDLEHERNSSDDLALDLSPIEIKASAPIQELKELQERIAALSTDVSAAQNQLGASIRNYETLLSSLSLGVMGVDENYRLRFCNDAMLEMIGDSAEASFRLRRRAEQLFEQGQFIDEHTLEVEGRPPLSLLLAMSSRKNDSGEEAGFWLLVTDLTKQKEIDSQLLQTSKLAMLGEMSTGMAHELNQPLNIIRLATNNMTNSISKGRANDESMMNRLQRIDSAVDRAATIIDHMRAFGRIAGEEFEPFSVSSSIAAASNLVSEPMKANGISLTVDLDPDARVLGNTIQFEQVLINMINNARDAILSNGAEGRIHIGQKLDAECVTVTIEDTGGGIPVDALPHIFEPFYTTKPVGKGTGLGGSISYGIIQDMQGSIWAENVVGGARISIRLPLVSDSVEHEAG